MKVSVKERSVYGNTLVYPNCEKSKLFAQLIGVKTFNATQLDLIRALGYDVEYIRL